VNYRGTSTRLAEYRRQIADLRDKMRETRAAAEPEEVPDYVFTNSNGAVRLSELFGDKPDLIVIHNMGASCPHCTLWADGFNGIYDHLANRAAFVLSSPDAPDNQKRFATSRGWRFPMVSHNGTTFAADMGYRSEDGGWRRAPPCSDAMASESCAYQTPASNRATTSAPFGTYSTCCLAAPATGRRNFVTTEISHDPAALATTLSCA